jgi:ATP-dependent helicase HrpB
MLMRALAVEFQATICYHAGMLLNSGLPIEEVIPDILLALSSEGLAVVQAPPGAGKTTVIPLALLDELWLGGRQIIMLEPRRLAARAAAMRMAALLGEEAGGIVGYRTRLDSRVGPTTRIEVVTEGILTRYLQEDPGLERAGCVIFDEFHERSLNADLGLALCMESRSILRNDLRLLVMSATIDGDEVAALLGGAPVIRSEGRTYPVEVRYRQEARPVGVRAESITGPSFISSAAAAVLAALKDESGSILVFLPGSGEIRRVESALREKALPEGVDLAPLYGELSREAQDAAIKPSPSGRRKVVLATSIAETSLTIEGVAVVIDCGLKRVARFSPATGMGSLETIRVTRDSAEQRKGRAGRTGPGVCVRLWTEGEDRGLIGKATPETLEADLAPLALDIAVWGAEKSRLQWLDEPPEAAFAQAVDVLKRLGAVDSGGKATAHGIEIAKLPVHPRLGHMAVKGKALGLGGLACLMAALLEERDIFKAGPRERDPDIMTRIEAVLGRSQKAMLDRALCERVKAASRQLEKRLGIKERPIDSDRAGMLLALAYPDRIGKKREGAIGRFLLANGRGARLEELHPLASTEYIVCASLDGGDREARVYLAAPVDEGELERDFAGEIEEVESVEWDESAKGVVARRQRKLWSLVLSDARLTEPSEEKVLEAFLEGIRKSGLGVLPWDRAAEGLRERINFLSRVSALTGVEFLALTGERLLENLEVWLAPFVHGMTRLEHLKRLDLRAALMSTLDWERQKALERLAPSHMAVPTGSRIQIDYGGERPSLSVRLQEMFGLAKTPSVAEGKVPLVVHLLSPAGRPVQVTDDLAGFWARSYEMVKKEMKGRYPRHHWPDNPMEAEPTRRAKRKGE